MHRERWKTGRGPWRVVLWLVLLAVGLLPPWAVPPAAAGEVGHDLIHNRTDRYAHDDVPGSVDSDVLRTRALFFWKPTLSEGETLRIVLEEEDYALVNGQGTDLVHLTLRKLHPRYRLKAEGWGLDLSMLLLGVERDDGTYVMDAGDDEDGFVLPGVTGYVTRGPLSFQLGIWDEYDVLPLGTAPGQGVGQYALIVIRNVELSAKLKLDERATGRAVVLSTQRVYPEGRELRSTDVGLEMRLENPLSKKKAPIWRTFESSIYRKHYPVSGKSFIKAEIRSDFRFTHGRFVHFLKPRLKLTNSAVVYVQSAGSDGLEEETRDELDFIARLEYEGFSRLGGSPFFLAWGITREESLLQDVQRILIVHAKITLTY